ncbi:MAG TPA: hypothetical protein VEB68_12215 [Croceibacterium sp.]|nr:hypothetical protein [Propylenella sp.]HYD25550.1 hypothetical protein [Croceibacterium sp.]
MKGVFCSLLVAIAAGAAPALAQGPIGTLSRGAYVCELPGDAAGRAGIVQPQAGFTIESASRYSSAKGGGAYLRRGDVVTLTSGPRRGESYAVVSTGFLRRIENGQPGRLRCVRQG